MILTLRKSRRIVEIPIMQIRPCRTAARKTYDPLSLRALAQSIRCNGILQPITVRRVTPLEYELIAGERRIRAAVMCGYTRIPCIVISCSDHEAEVLSLEENIQRSDLNCFEEAQGIHHLMSKHQMSERQTARHLGRNPAAIQEKIAILHFNDEEKTLMLKANLTEGHAKALLLIKDHLDRRIALSEVIEKSMNVSQTRQYVEHYYLGCSRQEIRHRQRKKGLIRDIRMFLNTINKALTALKVSGLNAETEQYESDEYIEYIIRIPKTRSVSSDFSA